MERQSSSASMRTLTTDSVNLSGANAEHDTPTASPRSVRSQQRKRMSLLPRDPNMHAAPPQLNTEYAFAAGTTGNGGGAPPDRRTATGHRASTSGVGGSRTGSGMISSPSEPVRLHDRNFDAATQYRFGTMHDSGATGSSSAFAVPHRNRKSSVSSARSSFINLPGVSPSLGNISQEAANAQSTGAQTARALEAMQRASVGGSSGAAAGSNGGGNGGNGGGSSMGGSHSSFTLPRQRTKSWQTAGSTEAARLASKLRMSRGIGVGDSVDDTSTSSASRMLANSGAKYFMGIRSDGPTAKALARYNKPTVSVFVKREDDFQSVEKVVKPGSLFHDNFSRASLDPSAEEDDAEVSSDATKAVVSSSSSSSAGKDGGDSATFVRFAMEYGLSGPAIQKTATTQALLSTCLDNDEFEASWAPALAHAAGLGDTGSHNFAAYGSGGGGAGQHDGGSSNATVTGAVDGMMLGTGTGGGVFINGPNATPLHFLHGLTNTTDSPFPLDEADMAMSTTLHDEHRATIGVQGEYVDAKNLRAVALTWAALNTTKNHIVTRRYVDPMRESLERVAMAAAGGGGDGGSALMGGVPSMGSSFAPHSHAHGGGGGQTPGSGSSTPGGTLRWGWRALFPEHA